MALVVAKSRSKLQPSRGEGAKERITIRAGEISGVNIPFGYFVPALGAQLSRPVANQAGLSGNFDLSLKWVPDANDGAGGPSLFTALVEQSGLKLASRKGSMEALAIDSAGRPGGN